MASNTEKNVTDFLRKELTSKGITSFVLKHAGKGSKGSEVETFNISEAIDYDQIPQLASLILSSAQSDADGMGPSVQRYVLNSYREEAQSSRVVFRLRGNAEDFDEDESGEEAPTSKGLLSQLMRHNEANNRALVGSVGVMMGRMANQMESLARVNEKLMDDRLKMFEILEEAHSRKHERDIERLQLESDEKRKDKLFEKASMLIPVILSKLTGGAIPNRTDPVMMMVGELVESLSVEQLGAIRSQLGPEQQIVFLNMLQVWQSQKTKALPNGATS